MEQRHAASERLQKLMTQLEAKSELEGQFTRMKTQHQLSIKQLEDALEDEKH